MKEKRKTIEFEGVTYSLRSNKIEIPNMAEMSSLAQIFWLNQNTVKKGHTLKTNPLAGLGGVIKVN